MRKLIIICGLCLFVAACTQSNEPGAPCGLYGEMCLHKIAVNN